MALPDQILTRQGLNTTGDNVREDLTDIIYNISPTERPFHMNSGRATAESDFHEWLLDSLADAVDDNAHVDGDDFIAEGAAGQVGTGNIGVTINGGERVGTRMQISRKDIVVSRRSNIVNKAGRKSEINYQIAKAGEELQRDCERAALANIASVQGSDTVAPRTAGLPSWLRTNTDRGVGGADPALSSGTFGEPTTAATDGTLRPLSQESLNTVIADAYTEGGDIDCIMMGVRTKQRFSEFQFSTSARIATPYQDHGKKPGRGVEVVGSVDVYVSDFGALYVTPNRFQRDRDVFLLEKDMFSVAYLDGYHIEKIGKTGDSEKRVMLVDWGVKSHNEASSGIVADVDANAPMVAVNP